MLISRSGWFRALVLALVASALSACGGGGGGSPGGSVPADQPTSIAFEPAFLAVAPGSNLYLKATAHFADGHSEDITYSAVWASSNTAVAKTGTINGIIEGVANGQASVTVTYRGLAAVAQIQVGVVLGAIDIIVPDQLGIGIGATFQFSALGQFTNGAADVTQTVTWTSSDPTVARVDARGLATGLAPGAVTVTASSAGVSTRVDLTILPIQTLLGSESALVGLQFGGLGLDASGRALAIWNNRFAPTGTPDIFYATRSGASAWTAPQSFRTVPQVELASAPHIAMNGSGSAVTAWHQVDGLYAAPYSPSTGWQAPSKLASQIADEPDLNMGLGIDAAGNALLTWKGDGTGIAASAFDSTTGQWSAPSLVPQSDTAFYVVVQARLAMSSAGEAMLAWTRESFPGAPAPVGTRELLVSRWIPGGGPGAGWQAPELMSTSRGNPDFAIASNDMDDFAVAWIITNDPAAGSTLAAKRFTPAGGWDPAQTIATGLTRQPLQPMLAMNAHGAAVLAWHNGFDFSVSTSLFDGVSSWTVPIDLYRPNPSGAGDPTVLKPSIADDGRALVPWLAADLRLLGQVVTARFLPGTGWEQGQTLTYTGRRGLVMNVDIEFDRSGKGAIFWLESAGSGFNLYANTSLSY